MVKQNHLSILQPRRSFGDHHHQLINPNHLNSLMSYYHEHACKKPKHSVLQQFLFICIICCTLIFASRYVFCSSDSLMCPILCLHGKNDHELQKFHSPTSLAETAKDDVSSSCFSVSNYSSVCCDRSAYRTDVCFMNGDVRTNSQSNSIILYSSDNGEFMEQRIKPYTRKWENEIMSTIYELKLRTKTVSEHQNSTVNCDVQHNVTAVVFSNGGYTGNVYHDFNDGLIPLYITSQHFDKEVVFVILQYHNWWFSKYGDIISQLSNYPPIDYTNDQRVHCFEEAIVGLQVHDELTVDAEKMQNNKTIRDFRQLLETTYSPRVRVLELEDSQLLQKPSVKVNPSKLKLVILSRNGSRAIENESELVTIAEEIGFNVEVISPISTMEMATIYKSLNSCDAMIGVHGAGLTHLLFMKPDAVFIQIVPLGMDWAAEKYYGEPAKKLGLRYMKYKITPQESSLYSEYDENDPIIKNPKQVVKKGWHVTKTVYLDRQKIRLNFSRFRAVLLKSHSYLAVKKKFFRYTNQKVENI